MYISTLQSQLVAIQRGTAPVSDTGPIGLIPLARNISESLTANLPPHLTDADVEIPASAYAPTLTPHVVQSELLDVINKGLNWSGPVDAAGAKSHPFPPFSDPYKKGTAEAGQAIEVPWDPLETGFEIHLEAIETRRGEDAAGPYSCGISAYTDQDFALGCEMVIMRHFEPDRQQEIFGIHDSGELQIYYSLVRAIMPERAPNSYEFGAAIFSGKVLLWTPGATDPLVIRENILSYERDSTEAPNLSLHGAYNDLRYMGGEMDYSDEKQDQGHLLRLTIAGLKAIHGEIKATVDKHVVIQTISAVSSHVGVMAADTRTPYGILYSFFDQAIPKITDSRNQLPLVDALGKLRVYNIMARVAWQRRAPHMSDDDATNAALELRDMQDYLNLYVAAFLQDRQLLGQVLDAFKEHGGVTVPQNVQKLRA